MPPNNAPPPYREPYPVTVEALLALPYLPSRATIACLDDSDAARYYATSVLYYGAPRPDVALADMARRVAVQRAIHAGTSRPEHRRAAADRIVALANGTAQPTDDEVAYARHLLRMNYNAAQDRLRADLAAARAVARRLALAGADNATIRDAATRAAPLTPAHLLAPEVIDATETARAFAARNRTLHRGKT